MIKVGALLQAAQEQVLDEAYERLQHSAHTHYEHQGEAFTRQRLAELFTVVVEAIDNLDLAPLSAHADAIAVERFQSGFDIFEVQAAFNALELAMWRRVVAETAPVDLAEAVGLLSTVTGFAKDVLARKYISLASDRHVRSLDMSTLFTGLTS